MGNRLIFVSLSVVKALSVGIRHKWRKVVHCHFTQADLSKYIFGIFDLKRR